LTYTFAYDLAFDFCQLPFDLTRFNEHRHPVPWLPCD